MGLHDARAAMNDAINAGEIPNGPPGSTGMGETPVSSDQAPELNTAPNIPGDTGERLSPDGQIGTATAKTEVTGTNKKQEIAQALLDLDKTNHEKILFQGKEWTKKDLQNAFLRQEDYSRKTKIISEQRQQVEQEGKFAANFAADVQHVLNNPNLLGKFKELYPARYHGILERIIQNSSQGEQITNAQNVAQNQTGQPAVDPALLNRLQALEQDALIRQQERANESAIAQQRDVEQAEAQITATFDSLSKKYPLADEVNCINAGQVYLEQNPDQKKVPDKVWDNIFKSVHEMHEGRYKGHYRTKINEQKQANSRGKDTPAGGGTPGSAPVKMRLKDVGEYAAKQLSGQS